MKPAKTEMRMMFQMESTNRNAADMVSLPTYEVVRARVFFYDFYALPFKQLS